MKKSIILLSLIIIITLFTSCTNSETTNQKKPNEDSTTKTETSNNQEISEEEKQSDKETEQPIKEVEWPSEFDIGDTLLYPNVFEIKMTSMEFATAVSPPNPDEYYTYYEVKEPEKVFIHTVFDVKNLKGIALNADEVLEVMAVYDEKYEYTSFSTIEEGNGSDFTYSNITDISPLTYGKLHFLTEVPVEVRDSGKPVKIVIKANNKTLTCTGNSSEGKILEIGENQPLSQNTTWKNYKQLNLNETVTVTDYADITITSGEFTTSVYPSNASSYYSYYEVDDASKIYAHMIVDVKNLKTTGMEADQAAGVKLIFDDTYEYRGFSAIEESGGGDFTYTNITSIDPLTTESIHYIVEVPVELFESGKSAVFVVNVKGTNFFYKVQ